MNNLNPLLLLVILLLGVGFFIAGMLSVYVAVKLARRRGLSAWPWALLALGASLTVVGLPLVACYALARANKHNPWVWLAAQSLAMGLTAFLCIKVWPGFMGQVLILDLAMLVGAVLVAICPLAAMGLIGPGQAAPADQTQPNILTAQDISRTYHMGATELKVLKRVSISVKRGEFLAILGASGSGKSTLLHILGLLDRPDEGQVVFDGRDAAQLAPAHRDRCRSREIGFVFQFYHLLPEFTALENVLMPATTSVGPAGWLAQRGQVRQRAVELLGRVGLAERLSHHPKQLSGGEQQRVAIARAIINSPKVLLADEPTGNLDSRTGREIIDILRQLNKEAGQTIVMVTHDQSLAQLADRVVNLRDGRLQ